MDIASIIGWLMSLATYQTGMATTFSTQDAFNPTPYAACLHRDLNDKKDIGVASRSLPCNSRLLICLPRTGKCANATVVDRGPYGKKKNGQFRADLDLTIGLKTALKHNGYEGVVYVTFRK